MGDAQGRKGSRKLRRKGFKGSRKREFFVSGCTAMREKNYLNLSGSIGLAEGRNVGLLRYLELKTKDRSLFSVFCSFTSQNNKPKSFFSFS
jgi:hypothetical protein